MMIVTAFLFAASEVTIVKWAWFVISCAAFLAVLWVLWVPLRRQNASETALVQSTYRRDAGMLMALWFAYPIILVFDTDGTGLIGSTGGVALIAIVDLLSKPVYGLLSVSGMSKVIDEEMSVARALASKRAA